MTQDLASQCYRSIDSQNTACLPIFASPARQLLGLKMATDEKEQVLDFPPKRIKGVKFSIPSVQDIVNNGVMEVCDRALYDLSGGSHAINSNGPLDGRMGISTKMGRCETCGEALQQCNGHFGYIRLALPCFHIGYLRMIINALQCVCKVWKDSGLEWEFWQV